MEIKLESVPLSVGEGRNLIVGQAHFIKTAEDIAEILLSSMPGIRYGLAFCEASGPCLIRTEGSDKALVDLAASCATLVGAGHSFYVVLEGSFPINVLNQLKACQEVAQIFCASANPLEVLVARGAQGAGILGVIDGYSPKGVEGDAERAERRLMLRKFGYKF